MRLSQAVKQWKDEWIAFRVTQEGDDPDGEVILHERDRARFKSRLAKERIHGVYITFCGELLPEGYAALF